MTEFVNQQLQEREARQAAEAKARMQAERQSEACRKLQARLKHMESISTFYNLNDKGERVFVSEEENLQVRDRFRASVREKCGGYSHLTVDGHRVNVDQEIGRAS